jgi:hypothetical protein
MGFVFERTLIERLLACLKFAALVVLIVIIYRGMR